MKMHELKQELAAHLVQIELASKRLGLPLTRLTLVARDPNNKDMFVILSNDDTAEAVRLLVGESQPEASENLAETL